MNETGESPPKPSPISRRNFLSHLLPNLSHLKENFPLADKLEQKLQAILQTKMHRREFIKWAALYSSTYNLLIRAVLKLGQEGLLALNVIPPRKPIEVHQRIPQENCQARVLVVDENGHKKTLDQADVSFKPPAGMKFYTYTLGESITQPLSDQISPDLILICVKDRNTNSYPVLVTEEDLPPEQMPYFYPVKKESVGHIKDLAGIAPWAEAQATNHDLFVFNAGSTNQLIREIRRIVLGDRTPQIPTPGLVNLN